MRSAPTKKRVSGKRSSAAPGSHVKAEINYETEQSPKAAASMEGLSGLGGAGSINYLLNGPTATESDYRAEPLANASDGQELPGVDLAAQTESSQTQEHKSKMSLEDLYDVAPSKDIAKEGGVDQLPMEEEFSDSGIPGDHAISQCRKSLTYAPVSCCCYLHALVRHSTRQRKKRVFENYDDQIDELEGLDQDSGEERRRARVEREIKRKSRREFKKLRRLRTAKNALQVGMKCISPRLPPLLISCSLEWQAIQALGNDGIETELERPSDDEAAEASAALLSAIRKSERRAKRWAERSSKKPWVWTEQGVTIPHLSQDSAMTMASPLRPTTGGKTIPNLRALGYNIAH